MECSWCPLFAKMWQIGMLTTSHFGLMMFWLLEDEAIVDECYEAATDASSYAGTISEGDSDTDHVELCGDQPHQRGFEFFEGLGAEVVEVPEYVPPNEVEIGTLRCVGSIRVKLKNSWCASTGQQVLKLGP